MIPLPPTLQPVLPSRLVFTRRFGFGRTLSVGLHLTAFLPFINDPDIYGVFSDSPQNVPLGVCRLTVSRRFVYDPLMAPTRKHLLEVPSRTRNGLAYPLACFCSCLGWTVPAPTPQTTLPPPCGPHQTLPNLLTK